MSFLSFDAPSGSPQSWPHPKSLRKIHPNPETTMKQNSQGLQTWQRKEELHRHEHPPPPAARLQPFLHLFPQDSNRHCSLFQLQDPFSWGQSLESAPRTDTVPQQTLR